VAFQLFTALRDWTHTGNSVY